MKAEFNATDSTAVTIREGHVRLRVWPNSSRSASGKVYQAWEFSYRDENGRTQRVKRALKAAAVAEARKAARSLANRAATDWSAEETADYASAKVNLFGTGLTTAQATWDWRQAHDLVPEASAVEVAKFWRQHHRTADQHTIASVVSELLAHRTQDGAGGEHLKDLKTRLKRLVAEVQCRLADLTAPVIDDWLRGLPVGNRSRRNYRAAVSNLIGFAKSRGYIPRDADPMKAVAMPKQAPARRGILSPEQMSWLIDSVNPTLKPVLLLGAFAGLRQSETLLLTWGDIDWEAGHIRVPDEGKTGGRLAPLHANLRGWLEPLRAEGPIVTISKHGISKAIDRMVEKANRALAAQLITWRIKWPRNGPRHSYASYRCALTRDVARVADEMGHSIRELARSYRNHKATPAQAKAWFEIRPAKSANTLELPLLAAMARQKFSPENPPKANRG